MRSNGRVTLPDGMQEGDIPERTIRPYMDQVVKIIRMHSFLPAYQEQATVQECLGIALAKYLEWSGSCVLEVAIKALEDANFSEDADHLREMVEEEEDV